MTHDTNELAPGSPAEKGMEPLGRLVYVVPAEQLNAELGDELNLARFACVLWRNRVRFLLIVFAFAFTALVYVLSATEWYRSEVVLAPNSEKATPGLLTQFGGLAGLAGITVGSGDSVEPIAVLRSREFAREFIEDMDLLPILFANRWDARSKTWKVSRFRNPPDIRDGVEFFIEDIRSVRVDAKTGLATLAIQWNDPDLAARWATFLVDRLNARMREQALAESQANMEYLRQELANTSVVTQQQAISRLLETEMQKLMLARGNNEFAFRVIDSAQAPRLPIKPRKTLIVLLGCLIGAIVGGSLVMFQEVYSGASGR